MLANLLQLLSQLGSIATDFASQKFIALVLFEGYIAYALDKGTLPAEAWVGIVAVVALVAYFVSNLFMHQLEVE